MGQLQGGCLVRAAASGEQARGCQILGQGLAIGRQVRLGSAAAGGILLLIDIHQMFEQLFQGRIRNRAVTLQRLFGAALHGTRDAHR